jgi:hypothetical protein
MRLQEFNWQSLRCPKEAATCYGTSFHHRGRHMEITPDKLKLISLVDDAYTGRLCLPNFQRDFVWPRYEVGDLVRSVLRGYFIGSLLLLRSDPVNPPFAPVFMRGARPTFAEPQPDWLILDGQQRLTSMIYALTAPNLGLKGSAQRRWFFIDLRKVLEEPDSDDIVFDRWKQDLDGLDKAEGQYERQILPCTALLRQNDFLLWRDGMEDWLADRPSVLKTFREELRGPWTEAVTAFQSFQVPVVQLPAVDESDPESIGRVCAIFEKLNSTGVELSMYDLLTARLYRYGIRLHDLWDQACEDNKLIREWSDGKADTNKFGVLLLRTLALLRGLDPKPRILIDLQPENFVEDWHRAAEAFQRALELVTHVGEDGFGVFNPKWLPYYGLLPILGALRREIEDRHLGEAPRADLRRWYWSNVFLERYSSAVESKSRKDYAEMLAYWVDGGSEPDLFAEARTLIGSPGYPVRDSASSASAIYSGLFCLLALGGARDWRLGENIQLQALDDHHIFPQAYLRRHGVVNRREINSITNRTLISNETNGKIKDQAPAEYVRNPSIFPSGPSDSLLDPHFLGGPVLDRLREASEDLDQETAQSVYDEFKGLRERAMIARIREVCGVAPPAGHL